MIQKTDTDLVRVQLTECKFMKSRKLQVSRGELQRLVDVIEAQVPGVNFDDLVRLVADTVPVRLAGLSPNVIRYRLYHQNIISKADRTVPVTVSNLNARLNPYRPLCVSYGAGVDSTALLVHLVREYRNGFVGARPNSVMMADTGGEKQETYDYLPVIQEYLKVNGFPPVEVVRCSPKRFKIGAYFTLEQNCLMNRTLPSLAFGRKKCSLKWKVDPMNARRAQLPECQAAWADGQQVIVAIGYDAGPKDSKRRWDIAQDERFEYVYPLIELGWDRDRCIQEIQTEGLPVPRKSACWFCPATQPEELVEYSKTPHGRDYLRAIIRMEENAAPGLTKIKGLWGVGVKGTRGGKPRPGRMTDFITQHNLLGDGRVSLPVLGEYRFEGAERCAGCF